MLPENGKITGRKKCTAMCNKQNYVGGLKLRSIVLKKKGHKNGCKTITEH